MAEVAYPAKDGSVLELSECVSFTFFPTYCSDIVRPGVKRIVKNFKILDAVISFDPVFMVHDLLHVWFDAASEFLFHYKTMFWNVTHAIRERMVWFKNVNIGGSFSTSTFPKIWVF